MAHAWAHIADYRSDDIPAQDELSALTQVWTEPRGRLAEKQAYREFEENLIREWLIETGLLE